MKDVKPFRIVGFIVLCIIFLTLISLVFPKNGILLYTDKNDHDSGIVDSIKLKFPSFYSFFRIDTTKYLDIDNIIHHHIDSNLLKELHSTKDSLDAYRKISINNPAKIHYPNNNKQVLHSFFDALETAENENGSLRVMHYGDSQIEMDRITSYIREQLQSKFGGYGPGFQPAIQVIPNITTRQSTSGNFVRYASWGFDSIYNVKHGRFGPMLNFCELDNAGGTIRFTPSHQAYSKAQLINNVKVLVGDLESDLMVTVKGDDVKYSTKIAKAGQAIQMLEWNIETFPKSISVNFSGGGTPEIYGIALDGKTGVSVDNLPMRGCSGTIFKKTNSTMLTKAYQLLNVKLLILEFGGNMLPSINGPKTAKNYGNNFYDQIIYLKNQKPDMDILVIGPADMSKRINGNMQSYPELPTVVQELKKATFNAGGAYWDTYEVMGGHNSMAVWVEEGLAGKDYIHFTTEGSKKISELFFEALINDYNEYRLEKRINNIHIKKSGKDSTDTNLTLEFDNNVQNKSFNNPAEKLAKSLNPITTTPVKIKKEIFISHIVKPGDTLWEISQKYNVSIEVIIEDNKLIGEKIEDGDVLKIRQKKLK